MSGYSVRRFLENKNPLEGFFVLGERLPNSKWLLPQVSSDKDLERRFQNMAIVRAGASESPKQGSAKPDVEPLPPVEQCPSLSSGSSSVGDRAELQQRARQPRASRTSKSDLSQECGLNPSTASPESSLGTSSTKVLSTKAKDNIERPATASACSSRSSMDTQRTEPALYSSIRTILAYDSAFAGLLISTIDGLPDHKRNVLLAEAPADGNDQQTQAQTGQTPAGKGGSSSTPTRSTHKRSASSQGQRDRETDDEGGSGGRGRRGPPATKHRKIDQVQFWICPFCYVFESIDRIARFKTCKRFGNLKTRKNWSDHLRHVHSPRAAAKDDRRLSHALYYMSEETWTAVEKAIKEAGAKRPRESEGKLDGDMKCFTSVWRCIFPKARHPTLLEPKTPFWSVQPAHHDIEDRLQVMLEAIFAATAESSVRDGTIATRSDFRPTQQDSMHMSKTALMILTSMSDTMSKTLVDQDDESILVAVAAHFNAPNNNPPPEIYKDQEQDLSSMQQQDVTTVSLQHQDTDVHLRLVSSDDSKPKLRVTCPPGITLKSFSQDEAHLSVTKNPAASLSNFADDAGLDLQPFSQPMFQPSGATATTSETVGPMNSSTSTMGGDASSSWPLPMDNLPLNDAQSAHGPGPSRPSQPISPLNAGSLPGTVNPMHLTKAKNEQTLFDFFLSQGVTPEWSGDSGIDQF